jgi:hypothetical protein
MEYLDADLFEIRGQDWLIAVDRYSGFPFVERLLHGKTTEKIIKILKNWFFGFGWPKFFRADGGPQFRDKFRLFCSENNITFVATSPYNHQSNGLAEAGVKNVKYLLGKCIDNQEDFGLALAEWKNSPRADGYSPSEVFFRRKLRGILPSVNTAPFVPEDFEESRLKERNLVFQSGPDKELPMLSVGDNVVMQNPLTKRWIDKGVVSSMDGNDRSYWIKSNGRDYKRNRRFLRLLGNNGCEEESKRVITPPAVRRSPRIMSLMC